jgi:hypothetical protein
MSIHNVNEMSERLTVKFLRSCNLTLIKIEEKRGVTSKNTYRRMAPCNENLGLQ